MSSFAGYANLGDTFRSVMVTRNVGGAPTDGDAAPTYRVYGPNGLMGNGTGSGSLLDSGTITGATNASPIVVTSAAHGLSSGTRVTISGVLGNTAANGTFTVTVLTADTFSIPVAGNGDYTSGGNWHTSGIYGYEITVTGANGYESGVSYVVIATGVVGGLVAVGSEHFTVQ